MKDDVISRQAAIDAVDEALTRVFVEHRDIAEKVINKIPSAQPEQTRVFVELIVEYPDPELCTYKEYRGKPYYSIKYIENGEAYIGYGTYKPEVLSQYLKEYFISFAQPEQQWVSCDERLPGEDGVYLVYAPDYTGGSSTAKENHEGIMFSRYKNKKWSIEHGYYKRPNCVRAWMPLPKLY